MILHLRRDELIVLTWLAILAAVACTERVPTTPTGPGQTTNSGPTAPSCTYEISPTNRSQNSLAATGTVSVTAPSARASGSRRITA